MNIFNQWGLAQGIRPQAAASASGNPSSAGSSSSASSANTLTANSFITLLTAQLQAQNPLNPIDPNQMVNELTAMNSLQQLIGIKQDLDSMAGATAKTGTPKSAASSPTAATVPQVGASNPAYQDYLIQQKLFSGQTPVNN